MCHSSLNHAEIWITPSGRKAIWAQVSTLACELWVKFVLPTNKTCRDDANRTFEWWAP